MTHVQSAPMTRTAAVVPTQTFEELFSAVLPRAYAAARYLTRDRSDAEDLVQESALRAYTGFASFQIGTNFKAWFLKILTNTYYMKCRRDRSERNVVSLDGMVDEAPDLVLFTQTKKAGLHDDDPDPAQTFMRRFETEQVAAAIRALPPEFRTVATLHFLEDLSYQEIADIVGCPIGTVRSRLHRGRKLLQVALWKIAVDHGLVADDHAREPQHAMVH